MCNRGVTGPEPDPWCCTLGLEVKTDLQMEGVDRKIIKKKKEKRKGNNCFSALPSPPVSSPCLQDRLPPCPAHPSLERKAIISFAALKPGRQAAGQGRTGL